MKWRKHAGKYFLYFFAFMNLLIIFFLVQRKLEVGANAFDEFAAEFVEEAEEKNECPSSLSGSQTLAEQVLKEIQSHKDVLPYPHWNHFLSLTNIKLNRHFRWENLVNETTTWPLEKVIVIHLETNDLCLIFDGPKPKQRFILMGPFDQNWGPLSTRFPWVGRAYSTVSERFHCSHANSKKKNENMVVEENRFHGMSAKEALRQFLKIENLVLWIGSQHTIIEHEKILSLPLGIIPRASEVILKAMKESIKKNITKEKLISLSFEMKPMRRNAVAIVNRTFNYTLENIMNNITSRSKLRKPKKRRTKIHSLDLLVEHNFGVKYVMSPPGVGEDCYRHWETLLMGSIPVTLSVSIRRVFSQLPVLFVQSWKEITPELLEKEYRNFVCNAERWNYKTLTFGYWHGLVKLIISQGNISTLNDLHPVPKTKLPATRLKGKFY